ncbi:hypothetical protein GWI33_005139 [Rhynchophorus ferrugineus]|uniref:Uncharacterized protein n=1 Tax=Rhynchophorus ferrugineus TaxID=354439 RepID=A0A834IWV8_RHYFE|nr:hypothetical protein GWI33_005139 [Rhynchophorus ferrugineus]
MDGPVTPSAFKLSDQTGNVRFIVSGPDHLIDLLGRGGGRVREDGADGSVQDEWVVQNRRFIAKLACFSVIQGLESGKKNDGRLTGLITNIDMGQE